MNCAAVRANSRKAVGDAGRQLEKRLAAQLVEIDLGALGQMVVERNDVQRAHTGQEMPCQLVHVQPEGPLPCRAENDGRPGNQMLKPLSLKPIEFCQCAAGGVDGRGMQR